MSSVINVSDKQLIEIKKVLDKIITDENVWVFGSRAGTNARRYSDLDLAVCGNKPLSLDKMSLLKEAFDESSLPWKVDVVDYSTVSADFQHIIDAHKIRLK